MVIPSVPIAVVIPAHNRAELLANALESVARQTVQPAETIVVDDGSTDDIATVVKAFQVQIVRQERAGAAAARNTGLRAASMPWVAFLDSDDLWCESKLELQVDALALWPEADVVFSDYSIYCDDALLCLSALMGRRDAISSNHINEIRRAYSHAKTREVAPRIFLCAGSDVRNGIVRYNCMLTSSLLLRRDAALEIGGFDDSLTIAEDWDFLLRLLRSSSAISIERPLVYYQLHPGNLSGQFIEAARWVVSMVEKSRLNPASYPGEMKAYWDRRLPEYAITAALAALRELQYDAARWFRLRAGVPRSLRALVGVGLFFFFQSSSGRRCVESLRTLRHFLRTHL